MEIYADGDLKEILTSELGRFSEHDCVIVEMETATPYMQSCNGLNLALDFAMKGRKVIVVGFLPPVAYILMGKSTQWFALIGHPKVLFCRVDHLMIEKISDEIEVGDDDRLADDLSIALLGVTQSQSTIDALRHDMSYALRDGDRMLRWEEDAKKIFGAKTRDELLELVGTAKNEDFDLEKGQLKGQKFPDVCIDVEGTLLDASGNLRQDVLSMAKEKSAGGPITIWTGGDVNYFTKTLCEYDVLYKVISKRTLCGASVRVVIDDLSEVEFKDTYNVMYDEYVQV